MTPAWYYRHLVEDDQGDDVLIVQRKIGAPMTGVLDTTTMSRVRGLQRAHGLPETGEVGGRTAWLIGDKASAGLPPEWFSAGNPPPGMRDPDAVRRFQSSVGLQPTGVIDRDTAVALADRQA